MKVINYLNRIIYSILCLLALDGLCGCKKFVQIGPPATQLATTSVFSGSDAATSAQVAIYVQMFSESFNMAQSTGLLSDELKNYATVGNLVQYYENGMLAINNPGPWINAYKYIYQANSIIAGLHNSGSIPTPIVAQLSGESKFIRAFWYFYLTNIYGDVPLVLTTDYKINESLARSPQANIYSQIISDLNESYGNLNSNYVDATDTAMSSERVRPNKSAAEAMLARVYLYTQKYDSADIEASLVINNTNMYSLCQNLSSADGDNYVFEKSSTEAIWQLATPLPARTFTPDCANFFLRSVPSTGSVNSATISSRLLNSFEVGDKRKVEWIGRYKKSGVSYYFPYKYKSYKVAATDASSITEYVMMLRLAEQYLIRAEARVEEGNNDGAVADLNAIRNRAGLPNYSGPTDKSSLLDAIMHERQVELFTEWGHRWFDLKRTGNLDAVMGDPGGVCQSKGGTWSTTDQLFPIPQSERQVDANLSQNNGY